MSGKKQRHKLATTTVEVYRLFKVGDIGKALSASSDGVVASLGLQLTRESIAMLRVYLTEQGEAIERKKRKAVK